MKLIDCEWTFSASCAQQKKHKVYQLSRSLAVELFSLFFHIFRLFYEFQGSSEKIFITLPHLFLLGPFFFFSFPSLARSFSANFREYYKPLMLVLLQAFGLFCIIMSEHEGRKKMWINFATWQFHSSTTRLLFLFLWTCEDEILMRCLKKYLNKINPPWPYHHSRYRLELILLTLKFLHHEFAGLLMIIICSCSCFSTLNYRNVIAFNMAILLCV